MSSNVGSSGIYEDGDQRPHGEENNGPRFEEGKEHSHNPLDSKDERSIANRLANEERKEKEGDQDTPEVAALKEDPTAPARMHGNEPSRGAKIDAEIQAEEEEYLKRKGKA